MKKVIKPGDLVILNNKISSDSLLLWNTWCDYDKSDTGFWPKASGKLRKNEIAVVIKIRMPDDVQLLGVKIYTEKSFFGWISASCLTVIKLA